MSLLIISCSLNKHSKSERLAQYLQNYLNKESISNELLNLKELNLPLCDAGSCYESPDVQKAQSIIAKASGYIICAPVYNYDLNAAAKNLTELTGQAWRDKTVSFAVAAGGTSSYMAPLSFANSLMIDFRCVIVPRFVYANGTAFNENNDIIDDDIKKRLHDLADTHYNINQRLNA